MNTTEEDNISNMNQSEIYFFSSPLNRTSRIESVASTSGEGKDISEENKTISPKEGIISVINETTCLKEENCSENGTSIFVQDISCHENDPFISVKDITILENNPSTSECDPRNSSMDRSLRRSSRMKPVTSKIIEHVKRRKVKPLKSVVWTKTERNNLLEGLKLIGDRNIKELAKFVPTKKPYQVDSYINSLKRRAANIKPKNDPLDRWLHKIIHLSRNAERHNFDPLPIGFLLISLFEKLPHPLESEGVDFRTLYEYLFCEMAELPLPILNIKSKLFLNKSLKELGKTINELTPSLNEELAVNLDVTEWPFNCNIMNPLNFPKIQFDVNNCE